MSQRRVMRPSRLWAAAAVAIGVTIAGCSTGSTSPTTATGSTGPTTTTPASSGGSGSSGATPLAQAVAYSQCLRAHGVPSFPDPVQTPDGNYGYRTNGIDPNSAAFQGALQACKSLPSPWNSTGQQLSASQQQAWLNWAHCIRVHGAPNFPDPTFSGTEVHDSGVGLSSPQVQSAMDACKSQRPSVGGLGG
ncbi:MAG TPA: hypothetical protein VFV02_16575 [Acidimicrobiales bacterium]|nr:hypothetical protein [Acidimicrobiales bacterium]